ncbi:MbeB family mobilization protein, partial [Klebsiella pneumoniae]|uniref:MbeB family mobilization protein n=1 Tax=Klebsiella pneumoniae TaxID=573 RepID=UPI001C69BE06
MSMTVELVEDFEQSSKQQANAIEKRLTEEFTRHEKAISGALKSSEEKMSAAIAEHSQKMGWLLLKTWIWMLVSIVLFLSATSGILWYQGELIAERQATLQA